MAATLINWLQSLFFGRARAPTGISPFEQGTGPARVLVMRHAEKTGERRDPHLSDAGVARAEKLVDYIPKQFGKPDFLFAATTSKRSSRPYDTLQPLADALAMKISEKFDDEDYDDLVAALAKPAYTNKFVVVAWRHSDIPSLCAALGAPAGTFPEAWDPDVYDLVIDISYRANAGPSARAITEPF